jgi:sulfotransferase
MSDKKKQLVFLSGLPRTGSTLLSSILGQNPNIHSEGNSALCQFVYDMHKSCVFNASEQLNACNRKDIIYDLILELPEIYYKKQNSQIVVDKCRAWMSKENIHLIEEYLCKDYKMIILERPLTEIFKSFSRLYINNNVKKDLNILFTPMSEPIMRNIRDIRYAKTEYNKPGGDSHFLFISYHELVNYPEETVEKIYKFCGWEPFEHNFQNVVTKFPEDDAFYGLIGLHDIRPIVKKVDNPVILPKEVQEKCEQIDKLMGYI